jgi:hypothetical protein
VGRPPVTTPRRIIAVVLAGWWGRGAVVASKTREGSTRDFPGDPIERPLTGLGWWSITAR